MNTKTIGGRRMPTYWERFDRLQRTADELLGDRRSPKGIFRFESHEQLADWQARLTSKAEADAHRRG